MLSLLAAIFISCALAATTNLFVAPTGSDASGDGSIAKPWATLARAQTAVRGINSNMAGDIVVSLRGGLYAMAATLELTPADSGNNGYTVRWAAFPGDAAPIIHGGIPVTGWTQVDAARNLWSAPLPAGASAGARQAYINGERMMPAVMSANAGSWTLENWGYTTNTADCPPYTDAHQSVADIELLYTGVGSSWTECRVRVAGISQTPGGGCNITMVQPGYNIARNRPYGQGVSRPASLQNVASLLTAAAPGTWYTNDETATIFYVPRPQDDMATAFIVVPSAVEVLLRMQGDTGATPVVPVEAVSLEGLTFAYAGWADPSFGNAYVDMQSSFRVLPNSTGSDDSWVPVPGNVQLHTVAGVTVSGCTFAHLGATALVVDDASQGAVVVNNTFSDVSCGGVYFGQVSDVNVSASHENRDHYIFGNYFAGVPVEFRDCAALLGGFIVNATIAQNSIVNNSNTGISLGWGWSRDEATNAANNTIAGNYIYGGNWLLEDGGSIYVLGPQPGSVIHSNYISNQRKLYGALYTDEGSAYWYISNNVVHDVPEWLHIWTPSIHDELVELNWSDQTYQDVHGTNCTVRNNVFITPGDAFPAGAQTVINAAGVPWMVGPKP